MRRISQVRLLKNQGIWRVQRYSTASPFTALARMKKRRSACSVFELGESVTSILYDEIRTKRGLAYEISSRVRKENGIKLLVINVSTAKENIDEVIGIIDGIIDSIRSGEAYNPDMRELKRAEDMLKIRRELLLEKSVQLAKELGTYELMYGSCSGVYTEFDGEGSLGSDFIRQAAAKALSTRSVQILK